MPSTSNNYTSKVMKKLRELALKALDLVQGKNGEERGTWFLAEQDDGFFLISEKEIEKNKQLGGKLWGKVSKHAEHHFIFNREDFSAVLLEGMTTYFLKKDKITLGASGRITKRGAIESSDYKIKKCTEGDFVKQTKNLANVLNTDNCIG